VDPTLGAASSRVDFACGASHATGLRPKAACERRLRRAEGAGRLIHLLVGAADIPGLIVLLLWCAVTCGWHIGRGRLLVVIVLATIAVPGCIARRLRRGKIGIRLGSASWSGGTRRGCWQLIFAVRLAVRRLESVTAATAAAAAAAGSWSLSLGGRLRGRIC